jgi:hypothetical protein
MPKQNPGVFDDLGKRLNDLLTKDFSSEKQENKFAWKGKSTNDVILETSFLQRKDGSIVGTFAPKYTHKDWNTTVSAEINTKKEVKAEISADNVLNVDGAKVTATGFSKGSDNYVVFGGEFKHEIFTATASVDYGKASGATVKGSTVIGAQGFSLGACAEYFLGSESELKELHTRLCYSNNDLDITVFGRIQNQNEEDKNELGVTYFHKVNADWQVGAEATFDTANHDAKPKLTFGTQYRFHNDSLLKAKFDTAGKLGLSLQQQYNKNFKLGLSSTVDTNNLSGKNSSATFGVTINLND